MKNQVVHKIGEAIIQDEAVELLEAWQSHDNECLNGSVTYIHKVISFIACASSKYAFLEEDKTKMMEHIVNLSELADNIERFKK